jgi:hypothetical protein
MINIINYVFSSCNFHKKHLTVWWKTVTMEGSFDNKWKEKYVTIITQMIGKANGATLL